MACRRAGGCNPFVIGRKTPTRFKYATFGFIGLSKVLYMFFFFCIRNIDVNNFYSMQLIVLMKNYEFLYKSLEI